MTNELSAAIEKLTKRDRFSKGTDINEPFVWVSLQALEEVLTYVNAIKEAAAENERLREALAQYGRAYVAGAFGRHGRGSAPLTAAFENASAVLEAAKAIEALKGQS
jgi:hypothetical protein